jgi:hypothetical protein
MSKASDRTVGPLQGTSSTGGPLIDANFPLNEMKAKQSDILTLVGHSYQSFHLSCVSSSGSSSISLCTMFCCTSQLHTARSSFRRKYFTGSSLNAPLIWKLNVHRCVHKSPVVEPIKSSSQSTSVRPILISFSHLSYRFLNDHFS